MKQNIQSRIEALEQRLRGVEVFLVMPDDSREVIRLKRGEDLSDLLARTLQNPHSPEAESILRCAYAIEPGGGHMIELAQALLGSPTENVLIGANQ
jgi:hypothetical protein